MVFRKTIIQVYSGIEPFGFDDFVRGTLRLFNYAIDHNIDVKVNVVGSEFEPYMIVNNYTYNSKPNTYYMNVDNDLLLKNLDEFVAGSDPTYILTSNVWLDRNDIYNLSYVGFDTLVRYREELYLAANQKVLANLLYRPHSDNLLYGYSIIYVHIDLSIFKKTQRDVVSLASQIRRSLDMNRDIMLFSNSRQLQKILSQYVEMNSGAIQSIDDSDVEIAAEQSIPNIEDTIIDFIILLKAKKIYRFSDHTLETGHTIKFTNICESAYAINTIIGNLEATLIPLYYQTSTLVTSDSPSGVTLDSSGNLYFSDTIQNCIKKFDTSGNLTIYAGPSDGSAGFINGSRTAARFNRPTAIACDMAGNIYVADTGNSAIRMIERNYIYDTSGNVIDIDGIIGTLISEPLSVPRGVAVDSSGAVYISDTGHNRICKVVSGREFSILAGSGLVGCIDGEGIEVTFNSPTGLTVDLIGNVFICDTGNNAIRRVTPSGRVTTMAGSGQRGFKEGRRLQASFNQPTGITVDLHNILYVADTGNNVIRRITNEGNVIPVVGSPDQSTGNIDGYGSIDPTRALVPFKNRATFNNPASIVVDSSRVLYVADTLNHSLRKIKTTWSTPTKIRPIAMQSLRITNSPGVAYTLGPTLSAAFTPPNTIVYGHKRGARFSKN